MPSFPVSLGFLADPEKSHLLHRRYFPSKAGGKPAWLDPINLPDGDEVLVCHKPSCCKQPLTFVLQVYAPRDSVTEAFHRTIFIFGCHWCSETFVALRSQLPRVNDFYPSIPADQCDIPTQDECLDNLCCHSCGIPTNKRVDRYKIKEIIEDDYKAVDCMQPDDDGLMPASHHRCKAALEWAGSPIPVVFEEAVIEIDDENLDPSKIENSDFSHEEALLKKYQAEVQADPECDLDDSEQQAVADIQQERYSLDGVFENFLKRIRLNPGHVIRYHAEDDKEATPLWFSSHELPSQKELDNQVGACPNCKGQRRFEFQIQPNLINDLWSDCRLTFGVLAVYTCAASCSPKRLDSDSQENRNTNRSLYGSYIEECVIRQQEKFCKT